MHFPHVCKLYWSDLDFCIVHSSSNLQTTEQSATATATAKTIITQLSQYSMHNCILKYTCTDIGSTNLVSTIYCSSTIHLDCNPIRCMLCAALCSAVYCRLRTSSQKRLYLFEPAILLIFCERCIDFDKMNF